LNDPRRSWSGDASAVDLDEDGPSVVQQVIREGIPAAGRLEIVEEARQDAPAE
jgi:hypothetical protein